MESTQPPRDDHPRREFARLRVGIPARIETLDGWKDVELVDLSQGGAQIVLRDPFRVKSCMLTWLRFEAFATVSWRDGSHLGLAFDEPLSHALLHATRSQAPDLFREEKQDVKAAAQAWAAGQGSR